MSEYEEFVALLATTQVNDNEQRTAAVQQYDALCEENTDMALTYLVQLTADASRDTHLRSAAYVYLKNCTRLYNEQCVAFNAGDQALQVVKTTLIHSLETETDTRLRRKLLYCICAFGGVLVPMRKWDNFFPALFDYAKHSDHTLREMALRIIAVLTRDLEGLMRQNIEVMLQLLNDSLSDESPEVRLAAVDVFASFLALVHGDEGDVEARSALRTMIPDVLGGITAAIEQGKEKAAATGIDAFCAVAEVDPSFLKDHAAELVDVMLKIGNSDEIEDATRRIAFEFILTFYEARPALVVRCPNVAQRMVPTLLEWLCVLDELDDEDSLKEWDAEEDSEFDHAFCVARDDLDRLALSNVEDELPKLLFDSIFEMLGNETWQVRHGALIAISVTAEGLSEALAGSVAGLVETLSPLFQDPHPRVRWAACTAAGQMCTDLGPELQTTSHEQMMQNLMVCLQDESSGKVRSHACSAIINFCAKAEVDVIGKYAEALLEQLGTLLQSKAVVVQEQALTAIASIASASKEHFAAFCEQFMPFCMQIIEQGTDEKYQKLRGKAFEAAGFFGFAVGKENFGHYSEALMKVICETDLDSFTDDDPQAAYIIETSSRMCELLGEDFHPYMEHLVGVLFKRAESGLNPEVKFLGSDDEAEDMPEGWQLIEDDHERIGLHTAKLDDAAEALHVLATYAQFQGAAFIPYVVKYAELALPTLESSPNESVRESAASGLPWIVQSAALVAKEDDGARGPASGLTLDCLRALAAAIVVEEEPEFVQLYVQVMAEVLDNWQKAGLGAFMSTDNLDMCVATFEHCERTTAHRRQQRTKSREADDYDEDLHDAFAEAAGVDRSILVNAVEILEHCYQSHGGTFVPIWRRLLPFIKKSLSDEASPIDRHVAVCLLDDAIEHGEDPGLEFFDLAFQAQVRFASDADAGVRQAALYGLGATASSAGPLFAPHTSDVLNLLWQVVDAPDSRGEEITAQVTENAISSIGKVLLARAGELEIGPLIVRWLKHLPVTVDDVEAIVVYKQLCKFLELYPDSVLGEAPNFEQLEFLLSVMGSALETKCVNEEVTALFVSVLQHLQENLPQERLAEAWEQLADDIREKLQRAMA